jgi:hypothetical protein
LIFSYLVGRRRIVWPRFYGTYKRVWCCGFLFLFYMYMVAAERVQQWCRVCSCCSQGALGGFSFIFWSTRPYSIISCSSSWSKEILCTKSDIESGEYYSKFDILCTWTIVAKHGCQLDCLVDDLLWDHCRWCGWCTLDMIVL